MSDRTDPKPRPEPYRSDVANVIAELRAGMDEFLAQSDRVDIGVQIRHETGLIFVSVLDLRGGVANCAESVAGLYSQITAVRDIGRRIICGLVKHLDDYDAQSKAAPHA